MTQTITQEAIALLIDLAEKGEIDPWDVQVIDVVDRFLARLISSDRKHLYESGQTFLYASMLVLLKANTLSQTLHAPDPVEPEAAEFTESAPIDYLNHIRRRPVAPQARTITLAELIHELEQISQLVAPIRPPARPKPSKISNRAAAKMIKQLAHSENLSEMANSLEQYFQNHPLESVEIRHLGQHFNDLVGVFWALLLLSAQGKVEVYQTDFYGEITVVPCI
ncbi:MAG: segregation/condensation protein A [Pseudanabaenaceae cyanobacterium bins.68]|nr:segregation/condensation protein A [Pseudanabaenaceae cyanobacterium bins.68]